VLIPKEDEPEDRIDAKLSVVTFPLPTLPRSVAAEVIELRLLGERASAPESIVTPLLIADLPVFCRWRGRPDFDGPEFDQLTDVADRLIVDSGEWPDVPRAYRGLARWFGRTAVSDLAWARTSGWRRSVAELWPKAAEVKVLEVAGPVAEAAVLAGWLRSRLRRDVRLQREQCDALERIALDGMPVPEPPEEAASPSDLLSDELERLRRDPIYEGAAAAAG
jgi:glucose-6-phosphate dehydrogenase assembly protein OpcA